MAVLSTFMVVEALRKVPHALASEQVRDDRGLVENYGFVAVDENAAFDMPADGT